MTVYFPMLKNQLHKLRIWDILILKVLMESTRVQVSNTQKKNLAMLSGTKKDLCFLYKSDKCYKSD